MNNEMWKSTNKELGLKILIQGVWIWWIVGYPRDMSIPVENSWFDESVDYLPHFSSRQWSLYIYSLQWCSCYQSSIGVCETVPHCSCQKGAQEYKKLCGNWVGKYSILRLIHCLMAFNDITQSFIHCYDSPHHITLKNRNSHEGCLETAWEKMSSIFNETEYSPRTEGILSFILTLLIP